MEKVTAVDGTAEHDDNETSTSNGIGSVFGSGTNNEPYVFRRTPNAGLYAVNVVAPCAAYLI